ncbi:MAG: N-acetylmuramoyl-L-alanine amidase [Planctomycetes bacterium]|nr:N-acetylmuramoyl-L-alanine amidase [Planctomycetota bacterium]
MRTSLCLIGMIVFFGTFAGCRAPQPTAPTPSEPEADPMLSVNTLLPEPEGFLAERIGSDDYPVPPYARFLEEVRICLDPGHGGDAHKRAFKRGPTGVREAEFNLRVANYLRALLTEAGAEVLLTREEDVDLSLAERAAIANEWGADLFISLHHNAIGGKPQVNRTTVWYHNDVDYRPSNLDLARYLCYGLYDSIALPQITGIPLHSDQLMYESGFGILRHADVTAALTESSFFTNPEEEQRLRDPEYNLLEAHGLFIALAKYAAAGLPRAYLIELEDAVVPARAVIPRSASDEESGSDPEQTLSSELSPLSPALLVFELDDGLRARKSWGADRQMILTDSITVHLDGQRVPHAFSDDGERYLLTVALPDDLTPGEHAVEVQFQNMNKNSVLNPHFVIEVP